MHKILIADDYPSSRQLMARRLTRHGFDVVLAEDGVAAVDLSRSEAPDLIIMDVEMPMKDGFTATREIKASPSTRGIPVIVLTGHDRPEDESVAVAVGCDAFVSKPVEFASLLARIERLIRDRS